MRDPIVALALAGTSRQERVNLTTGTPPVDALLAELPEGEVERTFLLSAGAWAVYRQAGTQARQLAEAHSRAADETLRECSPDAALLVSRLLSGEHAELLPEALEHLRLQGLRLPFRLLPLALNTTGKETRAALFPLLGERGRWLSQFNQSWKWVHNYLAAHEEGLPADAETLWQEGTLGQRVEILRRLRAVDAGRARDWLEDVWKQEKADARNDLLRTLESGLSVADEPLLEKALDDRAGGVRATAALLLGRLPNSAFSARMRQRGQLIVQMIAGSVKIKVPARFVAEWQRDGIIENPPGNISKRAWWMIQILATIEPTFWETHLGVSSAELLNLLPADNEWKMQIIEGWSKAAMSFGTLDWLLPLFSWWCEHYDEALDKKSLTAYGYREDLLKHMPAPFAEQLTLKLLEENSDWSMLVRELPRPWGVEFAQTYLQFLRVSCVAEKIQADTFNPYADPWLRDLSVAALALPRACFAAALQPWDFPADTGWQVQHTQQQTKTFTEIIQMRQKIYEEIM